MNLTYLGENDENDVGEVDFEPLELEHRYERVAFQEHLFANNSLLCLVRALVGKKATVELRNEIAVHGTIVHVDFYMAISMENCTVSHLLTGKRLRTEAQMRVSGSKVRYVHIPDDVNVRETITEILAPEEATKKGSKRRLRKDKDRHLRRNAEQQEEEEKPQEPERPKIFERRRGDQIDDRELTVQDVLKLLNI